MLASIRRTLRPWLTAAGPAGRDALAVFAIRIAWLVLEFLIAVLLARLLGAEGYGAYSVAAAAATLVGATAALGLDRLLVREVARLAGQATRALRALQRRATALGLAASLLGALIVVALADPIAGGDSQLRDTLLWSALLVPCVALARLRQGMLQGLGRAVLGQLPDMLVQPLVMLLGIAFLAIGSAARPDASAAMLAQVAAAATALVAGVLIVRSVLAHPSDATTAAQTPGAAALLREGLPFLLLLVMGLALTQTDTLLVGLLQDTASAGAYRAASQVTALIAFPTTAINLALAPRLAAAWAAGDRDTLQRLARSGVRAGFAAAVCIAVPIALAAAPLLALFGADFARAQTALWVLAFAFVINTATGTAGYMLIMTAHAATAARWFAVAAAVAVAAQWLLIPELGTVGAALGTLAGFATLAIGMTGATRRLLGIHTGLFGR